MLSWSSDAEGRQQGAGLEHEAELLAFTDAVAGYDDAVLAQTRSALEQAAGREFMIDAAAVAANFEMMTRVADGTGAY